MSETKRETITDLSDVRVGDWVLLDGYDNKGARWAPCVHVKVTRVDGLVEVAYLDSFRAISRRNVVAIEREAKEPDPKPGEWRHEFDGGLIKLACRGRGACQFPIHRVYRAATLYAPAGWSEDTRRGEVKFAHGRPAIAHGYTQARGLLEGKEVVIGSSDRGQQYNVIWLQNEQCYIHERNLDVIERRGR